MRACAYGTFIQTNGIWPRYIPIFNSNQAVVERAGYKCVLPPAVGSEPVRKWQNIAQKIILSVCKSLRRHAVIYADKGHLRYQWPCNHSPPPQSINIHSMVAFFL